MGAFSLGLFKGIGDQMQRYAEAEQKAAQEQALLDKKLANDRILAKEKQTAEQQNIQYRITEEAKQEQKKRDWMIDQTFGGTRYDAEGKRIPYTQEEKQQYIQKEIAAGRPLVAPSGMTFYGLNEIYKNANSGAAGSYLDMRNPDGSQFALKLPNSGAKNYSERILENLTGTVSTIAPYIDDLYQQAQQGDPYGNIARLEDVFKKNGGAELAKQFILSKSDAKGITTYKNPMSFFGADKITDLKTRRWYVDTFVKQATNDSLELLHNWAGIPPQLRNYSPEDFANNLPEIEKANYAWAIDSTTGSLKPEVSNVASKVSKRSGVRLQSILGMVRKADDPVLAMSNLDKDAESFNMMYLNRSGATLNVEPNTDAFLNSMYEKYNINTPAGKKALIRTLLPKNRSQLNAAVQTVENGMPRLRYPDRETKYSIDSKESKVISDSAKEGIKTISLMQKLMDAEIASPGATGKIVQTLGGVTNLVENLNSFIGGVKMDEKASANYKSTYDSIVGKITGQQVAGQDVFNFLAEQLAYAMASIAQKGASGRAISDRDVEAWRKKLGIGNWLSTDIGVQASIGHLKEELERQVAVHGDYAKAQSQEDFYATYIYDKTTGVTSSTVDAILANDPKYASIYKGDVPAAKPTGPAKTRTIMEVDPQTGQLKQRKVKVAPR